MQKLQAYKWARNDILLNMWYWCKSCKRTRKPEIIVDDLSNIWTMCIWFVRNSFQWLFNHFSLWYKYFSMIFNLSMIQTLQGQKGSLWWLSLHYLGQLHTASSTFPSGTFIFFIRISMRYFNPISTRGGHIVSPPVTYLCISVQIRVRARWKNLTFLSYEFGKGQYTFYPVKLSRFLEKK